MLGRKSRPSIEVRQRRDNRLVLKANGVKMSAYSSEKDFAGLDELTKEIVVEGLKLDAGKVTITVKDNVIDVVSDRGTGFFTGTVCRILGIELGSVTTHRGRYGAPTYGFNPR